MEVHALGRALAIGASLVVAAASARAQCEKTSFTGMGSLGGGTISLSGARLAVGSPGVAPGFEGVHVFVEQAGAWTQEALLVRPSSFLGPFFGAAVALDGDALAVGAPLGGPTADGAVFVYRRLVSGWSLEQLLVPAAPVAQEGFGGALALEGDMLVVGSGVGYAASATPGAVRVFTYATATGWSEQATLSASDAVPGKPDLFGAALALQGERLVVGAPQGANPPPVGPGEVYVFQRVGGTWSETARLFASPPVQGEGFGLGLALDGDTLAVGAKHRAYVLRESGGAWSQETRLEPGTSVGFFGESLGLAGARLLVGDSYDPDAGSQAGSVHVFEHSGAAWARTDKLYPQGLTTGGAFGRVLALEGARAVGLAAGRAYLFAFDDPTCPHAELAATPTTGPAPLAVAFTDLSTGPVTAVSWAFGDGASSSASAPVHTYASSGRYTVDLVASGPSGTSREIRRELVLVQTTASATVRNGTGVNRLCLVSTSLPVIGGTWTAEIDVRAHPGAFATALHGYSTPFAFPSPYGEVLVNTFSAAIFTRTVLPDAQGIAHYSFPIPTLIALDGRQLFTQGGIFGGGIELCNAIDLVVGY